MFAAKPSKYAFELKLQDKLRALAHKPIRLLEIGGGKSEAAERLLRLFPQLEYVSIEPDPGAVRIAKERFSQDSRVTILQGLGYGNIQHPVLERPFDIVFSLSVLEHVKDLKRFIEYSVRSTCAGGEIIHLYDLGHSLYPGNWKEFFQTRLCGSPFLAFLPEDKVARYLPLSFVQSLLEPACEIESVTYHNMPDLVKLFKHSMNEELMKAIVDFEGRFSSQVHDLKKREKLFPSVCLWAKKC